MINDDVHDELEHVDSFDSLDSDASDPSDLQRVDSFDDLNGNGHSEAAEPLENVNSFGDLADDVVAHRDATSDAVVEELPPTPEEIIEQTPDAPEEIIDQTPETPAEIMGQFSEESDDEPQEAVATVDLVGSEASLPETPAEEPDLDGLLEGFDDDVSESESAAVSEEISIAGESESAAVSQEIEEVAACARLVITPSPETVISGEQIAFSVEAFDKDNNPVEPPTVKWTAKGGEITKAGVYTAGRTTGLFFVKASTKGVSERHEGLIEAAPSRNEWVLASFYSACGIYLALGLTYFLDPAVLGPSKNFIGYFNFDWAIATILVGPCVICFISSALGLLSKPKGKEWLLLLPSFGPVIPVILGAISISALMAL